MPAPKPRPRTKARPRTTPEPRTAAKAKRSPYLHRDLPEKDVHQDRVEVLSGKPVAGDLVRYTDQIHGEVYLGIFSPNAMHGLAGAHTHHTLDKGSGEFRYDRTPGVTYEAPHRQTIEKIRLKK